MTTESVTRGASTSWWRRAALASLFILLVAAMPAAAQVGGDPFDAVASRGMSNMNGVYKLMRLFGIIGVIGVAAVGFFAPGKFPFKWLAAIAGGFVILALAPSLITFFTTTIGGGWNPQ